MTLTTLRLLQECLFTVSLQVRDDRFAETALAAVQAKAELAEAIAAAEEAEAATPPPVEAP